MRLIVGGLLMLMLKPLIFIVRRYIVQLLFMSDAGPDIDSKCKERIVISGENHPRFILANMYDVETWRWNVLIEKKLIETLYIFKFLSREISFYRNLFFHHTNIKSIIYIDIQGGINMSKRM